MTQSYSGLEDLDFSFPEMSDSQRSKHCKPSRIESYGDFDKWHRKMQRLSDLPEENESPAKPESLASNATYTLREITTPMKRWKYSVVEDKPPVRRRNSVARLLEHRYFEPWQWKPTGDPYTRSPYVPNFNRGGNSSTFTIAIILVIVFIIVMVLVLNKDSLGQSLAEYTDLKTFKVKVEDNVKNMIDTDFKPFSWQNEGENERTFGVGEEHENPTVMKHIRHFEEQLKRKPNRFFPAAKSTMVAFYDEEEE